MLICHCHGVNEATIRATILAGARQVDDVTRRCGAGGTCGGCIPAVVELLNETARATPPGAASPAA